MAVRSVGARRRPLVPVAAPVDQREVDAFEEQQRQRAPGRDGGRGVGEPGHEARGRAGLQVLPQVGESGGAAVGVAGRPALPFESPEQAGPE